MSTSTFAPESTSIAARYRRFRTAWRRRFSRGGAKGASGSGGLRLLLLVFLGLAACLVWAISYLSPPASGRLLDATTFQARIDAEQVVSATFRAQDQQVVGRMCSLPVTIDAAGRAVCPPQGTTYGYYTAVLGQDSQFINLQFRGHRATVSIDPQYNKATVRLLAQFFLPLAMLADFFGIIFVARSGQSGLGDIVGFGGMGRKRRREKQISRAVTFADVAGADEAVTELKEVVDYLRNPERFEVMGAQPPKGVLLFGPPGCGKTLLARSVAGESGVPFFSISGSEFVESLVGVGAARVRDLFRQVRLVAPAIVFIDEIDAAGRRRSGEGGSGGEREQTLNQLLVEMDGFDVSSGIVVVGATNRPDILDPALLRPGRFDRHVTVEQPDVEGREAILNLHGGRRPVKSEVDYAFVARRTPGFTGADLANVINEGALLAIREGQAEIGSTHISEAIQRVLAGPKRRGHLMSEDEERRVAYHESGHAIVAAAHGAADDVERLSIVARGRGLGQVLVASDADRVLLTRQDLIGRMAGLVAGIAAEELVFGEPSTTAEADIQAATDLAREIAGRYGMSPQLGRVRLMARDTDVYLGGSASLGPIAEETRLALDGEVRRLVDEALAAATAVLRHHRQQLDRLAGELVVHETIEGRQLAELLSEVRLPAPSGTGQATPPRASRAARSTGANGTEVVRAVSPRRPPASPVR